MKYNLSLHEKIFINSHFIYTTEAEIMLSISRLITTRKALPLPRTVRSLSTLSSYPNAIKPSKAEVQNSQLSPENLEIAIRSLYHDGLVVVNDVVPHDMLDRLNEKMIQDAHTLFARKENSPFNYNPNNIQQDAPPLQEYFEPQIFMSMSHVHDLNSTRVILVKTNEERFNRNPNYIYCLGAKTKMDILLREHRNASYSGIST